MNCPSNIGGKSMTKRSKYLLAGVAALFVVIVMCALGFSILLIGISNSRSRALKTLCATHLKSLGTVCAVYAAANNDALPNGSLPPGSWMCDEKDGFMSAVRTTASSVSSSGLSPTSLEKWFYCPANAHQDPAVLWGGPAAPYRVTGYVWTIERAGKPPLAGLRTMPPLQYHRKMSISQYSATAELLLDWIISDKPETPGASWTGITAPGRPGIYDTSHIRGKTPTGANVLAFDGSVSWRPFDPAKSTPVPQTPGGPTFWIPNP
jgi:hypothetical protein